MKKLIFILAVVFSIGLMTGTAHAKKFKNTPLPKNLEYAQGKHCGPILNEGFDMSGCKSRQNDLKIVGSKYDKDYRTSGGRYTVSLSKRVVKKAHKLKNGARVEAGEDVFGLTLVRMGKVKDKANGKKRRKRVASEWLVEPQWSNIVAWRSDFALVKKPGSQTWFRMSLPDNKLKPWHEGEIVMSKKFGASNVKRPIFLMRSDSEDTISAQLVDSDAKLGPRVDRVIKTADLPAGRAPIEVFSDGTLLVHRLDQEGKPYDQVFLATFDRALTPPIKPLYTVLLRDHRDDERFNTRAPLVEIDASKGLYWPVTSGVSVISMPQTMLGLRPFCKGASRNLSPVGAKFMSSGRYPEFKSCEAGTPECPFDGFWITVWNEPDGLTFSPTGEYLPKVFPDLDLLTTKREAFVFSEVLPVPIPEGLQFRGMHVLSFDREMNRFAVGRRKNGQYEAVGWFSEFGGSGAKLQLISASPRLTFQQAENDVKLYETFILDRKKAWAEAEKARQRAYQEDLKRRQLEAEAQAKLAVNRARQSMERALASRQYAQALDHAVYADASAVGEAAAASIHAGYGYLVSDAELYTAVRALRGAKRDTVVREMDGRRAAAREANTRPGSTDTSSFGSSPVRYKNPASISQPTDYQWKSKLNYLKGNTSQYQCGSSSFCN